MSIPYKELDTRAVHAGEPDPRIEGAVAMPIFQTAMFEYAGETDYDALRYIRLNNTPNHVALADKLAALEEGEAALVTGSGMAAISTALLSVLGSGDHLIAQDTLYGGTHDLLNVDLPELGIEVDFVDADRPETWADRLRPRTRAIYVETLTNPLLQMADLRAVVEFARDRGLVSMIDNTFASPVNFRPPRWGFDLSLHSGTKYLNGHSDIVAGAAIGRKELVDGVRRKLNHLGGSLDPHAAFLLHRGVKTLGVRVRQQNRTALELAEFLEHHEAVERVNYPGLPTHPRHERATDLLDGFGGMLSFELRSGPEGWERFFDASRLPVQAPSLGGVETLITRPATTSHLGMDPEERRALGIGDGLIRVSVGIESAGELIEDFDQALTAVLGG